MVKSAIGTVTAMKPESPAPPPEGWTHKLVMYYYRLPWTNYSSAKAWFENVVIPIVNAFEWFLGYDYLGYSFDWEGMTCTAFYRQKGSPAIPLAAIYAAIAVIGLIAIGIIILGLAWLRGTITEAETKATKADLLREGKITQEQYTELMTAESTQPAPWEKAVGWGVIILVLILAYVLLKPRGERR